MIPSIYILLLMCLSKSFVVPIKACETPNVGTVLFRPTDMKPMDCWTQEEIARLYSRLVLQDILPTRIPDDPRHLLEYFHLSMDVLGDIADGNDYIEMKKVLYDVFGGFLHGYFMPLLNEAYYEGQVDFHTAKQFYDIFDEIVEVLDTEGQNWADPMKVDEPIYEVQPLTVSEHKEDACSELILKDPRSLGDGIQNTVFLPVLNSMKRPTSIAVPFKGYKTYSLGERASYNLLVDYYTVTSQCVSELAKADESHLAPSAFDGLFYAWMKTNVLSHLQDKTLYVGFSNVRRIEATINARKDIGNNIQHVATSENKMEALWRFLGGKMYFVLVIALCLLLILGCLVCYIYFKRKKRDYYYIPLSTKSPPASPRSTSSCTLWRNTSSSKCSNCSINMSNSKSTSSSKDQHFTQRSVSEPTLRSQSIDSEYKRTNYVFHSLRQPSSGFRGWLTEQVRRMEIISPSSKATLTSEVSWTSFFILRTPSSSSQSDKEPT